MKLIETVLCSIIGLAIEKAICHIYKTQKRSEAINNEKSRNKENDTSENNIHRRV